VGLSIVLHLPRPAQKNFIIHEVIKFLHKLLNAVAAPTVRDVEIVDKYKDIGEQCAWMLCLCKYHSVSLTIVFMTSQFSGTTPYPLNAIRPRIHPSSTTTFPPLAFPSLRIHGPRVYTFGTVRYEIVAATNHLVKKIITMVIIMVGSYSLEEGMVYYLAGSRVAEHSSLPPPLSRTHYFCPFSSHNASLSPSHFSCTDMLKTT
jgi:hypothetical protein